jgi:hypothetical protein
MHAALPTPANSAFSDVFHSWNSLKSLSAMCFTLGIAEEVSQGCVSLLELLKRFFGDVFDSWNC